MAIWCISVIVRRESGTEYVELFQVRLWSCTFWGSAFIVWTEWWGDFQVLFVVCSNSAQTAGDQSLDVSASVFKFQQAHCWFLDVSFKLLKQIIWRIQYSQFIGPCLFLASFVAFSCWCRFCLRNDLYCVEWGVKLYSLPTTCWCRCTLCSSYAEICFWNWLSLRTRIMSAFICLNHFD